MAGAKVLASVVKISRFANAQSCKGDFDYEKFLDEIIARIETITFQRIDEAFRNEKTQEIESQFNFLEDDVFNVDYTVPLSDDQIDSIVDTLDDVGKAAETIENTVTQLSVEAIPLLAQAAALKLGALAMEAAIVTDPALKFNIESNVLPKARFRSIARALQMEQKLLDFIDAYTIEREHFFQRTTPTRGFVEAVVKDPFGNILFEETYECKSPFNDVRRCTFEDWEIRAIGIFLRARITLRLEVERLAQVIDVHWMRFKNILGVYGHIPRVLRNGFRMRQLTVDASRYSVDFDRCAQGDGFSAVLASGSCLESTAQWRVIPGTGQIQNVGSSLCLDVDGANIVTNPCQQLEPVNEVLSEDTGLPLDPSQSFGWHPLGHIMHLATQQCVISSENENKLELGACRYNSLPYKTFADPDTFDLVLRDDIADDFDSLGDIFAGIWFPVELEYNVHHVWDPLINDIGGAPIESEDSEQDITSFPPFCANELWCNDVDVCRTDFTCGPTILCEQDPKLLLTDGDVTTSFFCTETPLGQFKVGWATTATTSTGLGFSDDSYFVNVLQNGRVIYRSGEQTGREAIEVTELLGDPGVAGLEVQFECNLEDKLIGDDNCDDGRFQFKIVDCGCKVGEEVAEECFLGEFPFESARSAACTSTTTPAPATSAPTPDIIPVNPATLFCTLDRTLIDIGGEASQNFYCQDVPDGRMKFSWRTTELNPGGTVNDEYFITIVQNGSIIYRSGQHEGTADDTSDFVGIKGVGGIAVRIECDMVFGACDKLAFEFRVIDCACPKGFDAVEDCTFGNDPFLDAIDATCPQISPSPTSAPSAGPTNLPSNTPSVSAAPSPVPKEVLCVLDDSPIELAHNGFNIYLCDEIPEGSFKFAWQTEGIFADDEYKIFVLEDGEVVYESAEQNDTGHSTSGSDAISLTGTGSLEVRFQCTLETSFFNCDDGSFSFRLVGCGCGEGEVVSKECTLGEFPFEAAENAFCEPAPPTVPTPIPTATPTFSPTMLPSSQPTTETSRPTSLMTVVFSMVLASLASVPSPEEQDFLGTSVCTFIFSGTGIGNCVLGTPQLAEGTLTAELSFTGNDALPQLLLGPDADVVLFSQKFSAFFNENSQFYLDQLKLQHKATFDTSLFDAVEFAQLSHIEIGSATIAPTSTPISPTNLPSNALTAIPSKEPSGRPTLALSEAPTSSPILSTTAPSASIPTGRPTPLPTRRPTALPTTSATKEPTSPPTIATTSPTTSPVVKPSSMPSASPIVTDSPIDFVGNSTCTSGQECTDGRFCQKELCTLPDISCIDGNNPCLNALGVIGENSCKGSEACRDSTSTIGNDSCHGRETCERKNVGSVGVGSCRSTAACKQCPATVGNDSCVGPLSCRSARSVIGDGSCQGSQPCRGSKGLIGNNSCKDFRACAGTAASTTIGDASCHGNTACRFLTGSIGNNSCLGANACSGSSGVGNNSCQGDNACLEAGVPIGNNACNGAVACNCEQPLGTTESVPDGACNLDQDGQPTCCLEG